MYHDGPATAYLSKAPGELNDYTGDGDWYVHSRHTKQPVRSLTHYAHYRFKIAAVPASDGLHWDYGYDAQMNIVRPLPLSNSIAYNLAR
jgi:hypothetical protein